MKRIYIICMCLCFAVAAVLVIGIVWNRSGQEMQQEEAEALRDQLKVYQTTTETELPEKDTPVLSETEDIIRETEKQEKPEPEKKQKQSQEPETMEIQIAEPETQLPETEPTIAPATEATLDFQTMWETNPDICAWIEIEGTKVDYPVLQSPDDDNKYLNTAADGSYYIGGSIFTQATYNSRDFNDPVTLIYGHTMLSGTLFGQLQTTYSGAEGFAEHREIRLYLPEEVRTYTVFAAVPYSNIHIPATYDFTKEYWFHNFFDSISDIRELGAQFDREITPEYDDRVIILSTCMNEDSTRRFLVMAICQDDIP